MNSSPAALSTINSEIIELIKVCRELGVSHFEGNGLKLEFGPAQPAKFVGIEDPALVQRAIEENELRVKQDQLDAMKSEDPFAYEQHLISDLGRSIP